LKKSAPEILDEIRNHIDLLAEAGAGFVLSEKRTGAAGEASGATASEDDVRRAPPGGRSFGRGRRLSPSENEEFDSLERRILSCTLCPLHKGRTHAVPGEGDRAAELMFVGEGPGRDEDAQGRPFVGRAGQLLRRIIAAMKFEEAEVYITNVVKCRPPENRVPHRDEIEICAPTYLLRQIELLKPKVIVALGRTPTDYFVPSRPGTGMSALRGRFADFRGIPVMPTFHPSYLVRNEGNRELRRMVWEDVQKVMALLGRT
jgi:uracil-DNA glycosylase family 4